MGIVSPDTNTLDLQQGRGSKIDTADTYVRPVVQTDDERWKQFAQTMQGLAGTANNISEQQSQLKEQQDRQNLEYHASRVRQELGTSAVTDAQIGAILPDQSSAVRGLVAQKIGQDDANTWMAEKKEAILQNPSLRLDPDGMEAALQSLEAEATQRVQGQPFYGAGFVGSVKNQVNQLRQITQAERSHYYDAQQADLLTSDYEQKVQAARAGTQPAYVFNSPSAQKLAGLDFSQAPSALKLAASMIGTNEQEGKQAIAALIKQGCGKTIDPSVTPWCGAFVDGVLGKSGLPTRGSFRAADFKTYGTDAMADPKVGDIIVLKPQARGASGHVGFVAGINPDGSYRVLGGNQSNEVNVTTFGADQVVAIRRPAEGQFKADAQRAAYGGTAGDYTSRVFNAESGGDPNAQNPTSSAAGLAGFTNRTWLGYVKNTRPDLAEGKTDAQILGLRSDPKIAGEMTQKYAEDNAKLLQSNDLPVNNANLYLGHLLDGKNAVKVLKANDGTPVEQVLSPDQVKANGWQGLTVGELKQKAAEKVGQPVDGTLASQNAVRQLDRTYGKVSSLDDIRRRDVLSKYAVNQAIATGDTHYLDAFPPELQNPAIQGQFAEARKKVEDLKWQQYQRSRQVESDKREDEARKSIDEINADVASGKEVDPRKYAGNKEAFNYAYTIQQQERNISPVDSTTSANRLQADLERGAVTNDFSHLLGDDYHTKSPSLEQLQDVIRKRTDLKAADKQKLIDGLKQTLEIGAVAKSPEIDGFYSRRIEGFAKGASQTLMAKLGLEMGGVNIEAEAKHFYEDEVHDRLKSWTQSHGHVPFGEDLRLILRDVEKDTNDFIGRRVKGAASDGPTSEASPQPSAPLAPPVPKPAVAPAKPAAPAAPTSQAPVITKVQPNGTEQPVNGAHITPPAGVTFRTERKPMSFEETGIGGSTATD